MRDAMHGAPSVAHGCGRPHSVGCRLIEALAVGIRLSAKTAAEELDQRPAQGEPASAFHRPKPGRWFSWHAGTDQLDQFSTSLPHRHRSG